MMCQRMGLLPISIIGLGLAIDSSLMRVPAPPARITAFTVGEDNDGYSRRAMAPEPSVDDLDQILDRLGLTEAPERERRQAVARLAYEGRVPLPWLSVLRQADYLPYDMDRDE